MALDTITTYCTRGDVENLLSVVGVTLRLDDDDDGLVSAAEVLAMTDAIVEASETCNYYLYSKYAPEILATSNWINRKATILAAYRLCTRRGNPAPDALVEDALKAEEQLTEVREGRGMVPGVPLRRALAPVWSNTRVVPWYQFRCIRVERQNSSQHNRSGLPQNVDHEESAWIESR